MKTSNKLLIAILVFLPVSLVLYNFLLKGEFVKGNIRMNAADFISKSNKRSLKPFRHIVYDGALWKTSENGTRRSYSESHNLQLFFRKDTASWMELSPMQERYLKVRQEGDTLFISYLVDRMTEGKYFNDHSLRIYAQELASVTGDHCWIEVFGVFQEDIPLKVHVKEKARCLLYGGVLPRLDLQLETEAICDMSWGGAIDTLAYRFGKQATLNISNNAKIGVWQPESVDSTATIALSGSAASMTGYLQAKGE